MNKIAIPFALLLFSSNINAAVLNIRSLDVSGGYFAMNDPIDNSGDESAIGPFTLNMGVYENDIVMWHFGDFGPIVNYTAASCDSNCYGGGPPPSGTVDDVSGTITVDMSSWFGYWSSISFDQGGTATGSYDAATGAFSMTWSTPMDTGPFPGNTSYYQLSGTVNAVPVPAAVWFFTSGLVGLLGLSRRRKQK